MNDLPGIAFTRACIALAASDGVPEFAADLADKHWGPKSGPSQFLKAATPAANTNAADWAGNIAETVGFEFINLVNEISVVGRVQARRAPLNVKLSALTTGTSAVWRGQTKAAPMTTGVFSNSGLEPLNLVALAAISKALLKFGAPNNEIWIRDELVRAVAQRIDTTFLSNDAAVADVSPPGVLNGVTTLAASSSNAANVAYDMRAIFNDFAGDLTRSYAITRPAIAAAIQSFEHPHIGVNGGELLGLPVLTTRYAPDETIIILDADGIAVGDEGISVETAEHADVEMLDASLSQDGTDGTGAQMVSLWQLGLVGLAITRRMNWQKMRPCVSALTGVEYRKVSA